MGKRPDRYYEYQSEKNSYLLRISDGERTVERYIDADSFLDSKDLSEYYESMEEELDRLSKRGRMVISELPKSIDFAELQQAFLHLGFDFTKIIFRRIDFLRRGVYVEIDASDSDGFPQYDEPNSWATHRIFIPYATD